MYSIGEIVMHGYTGICQITEVVEKEVAGLPRQNYYVLRPLYDETNVIYIPISFGDKSLRKPLSKNEVLELVNNSNTLENKWLDDIKKRKDNFNSVIIKANPRELLSLIKTIYSKNLEKNELGKKLSDLDRNKMLQAKKILEGELAYSLSIPIEEVSKSIAYLLEKENSKL